MHLPAYRKRSRPLRAWRSPPPTDTHARTSAHRQVSASGAMGSHHANLNMGNEYAMLLPWGNAAGRQSRQPASQPGQARPRWPGLAWPGLTTAGSCSSGGAVTHLWVVEQLPQAVGTGAWPVWRCVERLAYTWWCHEAARHGTLRQTAQQPTCTHSDSVTVHSDRYQRRPASSSRNEALTLDLRVLGELGKHCADLRVLQACGGGEVVLCGASRPTGAGAGAGDTR
jgi:hypothetical protein